MEEFLPYLKNGVVEGAIYALIALGYTMVYGILGLINFAHGEIYMIGGYAGILFFALLAGAGVVGASVVLAIVLCLVLAAITSSLWGASLERVAYRPLRNAPSLSPLISAIGASFFLWNFVMVAQGNLRMLVPDPMRGWLVRTRVELGRGVTVSALEIGIFAVSILLMVALQLFIKRTRMGKAMRAVAQDRTMASLVGIPINRVIVNTFVIGSALAAIAGVMGAMYSTGMLYTDGYLPGIKAFTAAVLGGIGNVPGAMLGGFVIGIAENVGTAPVVREFFVVHLGEIPAIGKVFKFIGRFFGRADYKDVYSFVILMLVLIFRPQGILGERVSEKV